MLKLLRTLKMEISCFGESMKKQLSSLDMHLLLKELEILKDSRVDKIYNPEKNILVFSLYKSRAGKKLLEINVEQSLFMADTKESYGKTLGFGMFLRKHLDGYFLYDKKQNRIIIIYNKNLH